MFRSELRQQPRPCPTDNRFCFTERAIHPCSIAVDTPSPRDSDLQKPLEHFRANTKRLKIHPAEMAVLWVVGAHLVFLPWAIGGMRVWGQVISLILAAIGFAVALVPRNYTEDHTGSNRFRLIMWPKLLKFPIFWIGLAVLGLVVIQALNPAWTYETDGKYWWMRRIEHIAWLPPGVHVPFALWGPWRKLIIYASAWLTVCSIWIAFTRRRTVQLFFITVAVNGLALAGFGLFQRLAGNGKMFWLWISPSDSFFSSFVYKNHAGAYLDLALATACGLTAWYYLRGLRRLEKSNPSGLFAFFATCIAVTILVSYARGATLVMLIFLVVCIGAFVVHQFVGPAENRKPVVAIVLILIFGYFLKTGLDTLGSHQAWTRLKAGITREDSSLAYRELATKASIEMLHDYWGKGAGAGSYTFLFPTYQHRYPKLTGEIGARQFWEHAHNDVLELSIELGLSGFLLIFGGASYLLFFLVRNYFWQNPLSAGVVFGLVLMVGYAWWDFPFQCPAVLLLWCSLSIAVPIWTQFEEMNVRG